ncbi:MAG TPA: response regulator transcription factor [Thermoanaerobaculia bacterium]|nr:response regulator transcription factor [Thermoanaerobaculia bacterium]
MINIVLADDHPIVRRGLTQFFEEVDDLRVVAECEDGESALDEVRKHNPDVLIVDLRMPRASGLEVLRRLRSEEKQPATIILAGNISDDEVVEAMRLGAKGVVLKEMAPMLLVQCIRKVAAGGVWLEKEAIGRTLGKLLQGAGEAARARNILTNREIEIVRMVAEGFGNREVAERLFISEGTVKSHLHTIYEKLALKSRVQLVAYVRENGLM